MMPNHGHPELPAAATMALGGMHASALYPPSEPLWPTHVRGHGIIAVACSGAVTAMNLTAVKLFGLPAPHQMGLGLKQFIATRYHRVIDAWSGREAGDARAAHPDPLTLSLSAKRKNGSEVRVMMTRRMLCEGREGASWLVTVREVTLVPMSVQAPFHRRVPNSQPRLHLLDAGAVRPDLPETFSSYSEH